MQPADSNATHARRLYINIRTCMLAELTDVPQFSRITSTHMFSVKALRATLYSQLLLPTTPTIQFYFYKLLVNANPLRLST